MYRILALFLLLLLSCTETEFISETMLEQAIVEDIIYSPGQHGSGSSIGIDTNLDIQIMSTDINTSPQYAIVFKCMHGRFVIQGESEQYKKYWQSFNKGQTVTIEYKEIYNIENNRRTLLKYDFIDAY